MADAASQAELARSKRQQALAGMLAQLADERGELSTPEDKAEISRYMVLLDGAGPVDAQLTTQ